MLQSWLFEYIALDRTGLGLSLSESLIFDLKQILWLAAFIAVATYNPDSMNQDSEDEGSEDETENEDNDDGGGCSALCNTNKASVAFGVFNL